MSNRLVVLLVGPEGTWQVHSRCACSAQISIRPPSTNEHHTGIAAQLGYAEFLMVMTSAMAERAQRHMLDDLHGQRDAGPTETLRGFAATDAAMPFGLMAAAYHRYGMAYHVFGYSTGPNLPGQRGTEAMHVKSYKLFCLVQQYHGCQDTLVAWSFACIQSVWHVVCPGGSCLQLYSLTMQALWLCPQDKDNSRCSLPAPWLATQAPARRSCLGKARKSARLCWRKATPMTTAYNLKETGHRPSRRCRPEC